MDNEQNQWMQRMQKRWAVVGFTHERAKEIIDEIVSSCGKEISRKLICMNEIRIEFTDGTVLRHIRASNNARGHKFGKMWCDKNINRDIFDSVIMPIYFGERDDIVWL